MILINDKESAFLCLNNKVSKSVYYSTESGCEFLKHNTAFEKIMLCADTLLVICCDGHTDQPIALWLNLSNYIKNKYSADWAPNDNSLSF